MNFQQLRYIRAAVKNDLNLTKVANELFTSQSGVSKQIRELEQELRVDIFVRRGKRLENEARHRRDRLPHDPDPRSAALGGVRGIIRCIPALRPALGAGRKHGARMWVTAPRPSSRCRSSPTQPTSSTGATRLWRSLASRCG